MKPATGTGSRAGRANRGESAANARLGARVQSPDVLRMDWRGFSRADVRRVQRSMACLSMNGLAFAGSIPHTLATRWGRRFPELRPPSLQRCSGSGTDWAADPTRVRRLRQGGERSVVSGRGADKPNLQVGASIDESLPGTGDVGANRRLPHVANCGSARMRARAEL